MNGGIVQTPHGQDRKPGRRYRSQYRDSMACPTRRQHQLEQGNGISDTFAERSQRTVTAIYDHQHALDNQRRDRRAQHAAQSAAQRTPPDVSDACQENNRN